MKKIKICHIVNQITGKADGVFSHIKILLDGIDKNQFEQIVVFQGAPEVESALKKLGIRYYVLDNLKKKFSFKLFFDFARIIKKENIQVIHSHLLKPYSIAGICNLFLKRKLIFNYHGYFISNEYNSFFERAIYSFFNIIITRFNSLDLTLVPTNKLKSEVQRKIPSHKNILAYYTGSSLKNQLKVDDEIRNRLMQIRQQYFLIGVLSRFEREKRTDIALEVSKTLIENGNNIFLVLFGDGRLENQLKVLSQRLKINESVYFAGYSGIVNNYLDLFDLLLITSDREGFPMSIWEAMASSVPVVSSDVGGISEVLKESNCGLVFERRNIPDAVAKIESLISDEKYRINLGENGREAIRIKYPLQNFILLMQKVYYGLAD
jgi:glycosyltransferase involved in cell wall biosynthesis